MGLISVIVPIYNVQDYLRKCIDSIINQTYRDLEIILIDDGSTDSSGKICDEYLKIDHRIRVYHKKNGGLSSARNAGLKMARGEWIGFVDSDDYIEHDMYELLLSNMGQDVDIVCCSRKVIYPPKAKKQLTYRCALRKGVIFSREEAMRELLLQRNLSFSVCTKLFRKSLIKDMQFPYGKTSEDLPFAYEAIKRSRNVAHIGKPKYMNYCRENSISRKPFYIGRIDYVKFSGDIYRDIINNYPTLKREAAELYLSNICAIIMHIEQSNSSGKYEKILKKLKKELLCIGIRNIWNPYVSDYQKAYILRICVFNIF